MIILLKLLAVYSFFIFLAIGIYFSKIKIHIKYLEYEKLQEKVKLQYNINLGIFLYGNIKILGIRFEEDGMHFLWKKISYEVMKESHMFTKITKENVRDFEKDFQWSDLKKLKPKLEKLDLNLDLGFKNVLLTSFMIFAISTILSIAVRDSVKRYNPVKYQYIITPYYKNTNIVSLKANSIIAIKTAHIMNILLNYKKRRVKNYERTSYRRSYENSYE